MPRKASAMTIAELRRYLEIQQREVDRLMKTRRKLLAELARIDQRIVAAGGTVGPAPAPRTRARRAGPKPASGPAAPTRKRRAKASVEKPLVDYVAGVLKGAKKGMRVKDVMQAVTQAGYKSRAKDFYGIVAAALRDDPRFKKLSRGVYALK